MNDTLHHPRFGGAVFSTSRKEKTSSPSPPVMRPGLVVPVQERLKSGSRWMAVWAGDTLNPMEGRHFLPVFVSSRFWSGFGACCETERSDFHRGNQKAMPF